MGCSLILTTYYKDVMVCVCLWFNHANAAESIPMEFCPKKAYVAYLGVTKADFRLDIFFSFQDGGSFSDVTK